MAVEKKITSDSRYPAFVRRYAHDCLRFAIEVVGLEPTHQQVDLFESVSPPGSRTSVSSGHGTGKTNSFGIIGLWHLAVYVKSNCIITAPRADTVRSGVWKEFAGHFEAISNGPHAWICDYIVIETEKVYMRGHKLDWWIIGKTAPLGRPENIAGAHNSWLIWLCDESSGIPDKNFGVIGGSLTDERNRMVCASQPTRPSGFFYDTHNRLSSINGGPWNSLVFNSEDSPLVSDQFIRDKLLEYGGRDAVEYQIKVLGQFPENSDRYLVGRKAIEKRVGAGTVIGYDEFFGHVVIVDVAAGVHRDRTVATHVRMIGNGDRMELDPRRVEVVGVPLFSNSLDWTPMARTIVDYAARLSNCTIVVDINGMGVQFAKKLEEFGARHVIYSRWGDKPFKKRYKERFYNLRAQCSVHAAEAVKDGRITFCEEYKKELLDQGSRIPFFIDEKGLWHIMKKEDMAKEGLASPDYWDTICMAFLEDVHYIQHEGMTLPQMAARTTALREAAETAFNDLDGIE